MSTEVVYSQRCLVVTWLVPRETHAAVSARSVYTIQPCTVSRHFMQSRIRRVQARLAVTGHLHFWQNDRDLLRATAVTRGWNGYRNKLCWLICCSTCNGVGCERRLFVMHAAFEHCSNTADRLEIVLRVNVDFFRCTHVVFRHCLNIADWPDLFCSL